MVSKSNPQPVNETRWYYMGPDNECYGPYTNKDMTFWTQSGYFSECLPVRTENETQYHTLGEWTTFCGGTLPFLLGNVHSMESFVQQFNMRPQGPPGPPMMIMPTGVPPYPPPVRFPHSFVTLPPIHHQMGPNGQTQHQMHSQPPSEPIDAGSLSHTPDSEKDIRGIEFLASQQSKNSWLQELGLLPRNNALHQQQQMQRNAYVQEGPQMQHAQTETDKASLRDSSTQTEPLQLSKANAIRVLSELFGSAVVIN
ncbi:unnamed protein product [Caenorhabditis bovis]|uniref:GYF domain-containing protein n=1 Tax=Caenorhabditis bovis TaxID=2654633 RepID=A0A8S1EBP5_9PELO|nr:unnamed protein product [Caenorhabditis bovis]